jgi:hypothetical protein
MAENHHSDREPPPHPTRLAAALLLVALVLAFHWRLTLTSQFTWLPASPAAARTLEWYQFAASELHRGRLPLWDITQTSGQSLWAQPASSIASPLLWPLLAAPLKEGLIQPWAVNAWFLLLHLLGAAGAYRLARGIGLDRPASLIAGLAFSLCGWWGDSVDASLLLTGVWTPLVFLYAHRRMPARAGFFLGLSILGGHIPLALATAVAAIAWIVWRARSIAAPAIFIAVAALTGALSLIPARAAWLHPQIVFPPLPVLGPVLAILVILAWRDGRLWLCACLAPVAGLGLALAAALGFERLENGSVPRWLAPLAAAGGLGLLVRQYILIERHGFPGSPDTRAPMFALLALLAAALLAAVRRRALSASFAVALLLIEMSNGAALDMPAWIEPGRAAHVVAVPAYQPQINGPALVEASAPNRVRLRVNLDTPGRAGLAGTSLPGWRATLDGCPVLPDAPLPAGRHVLEYRYRPLDVPLGAGLSLAGCALAFALRRSRP